MKVMRILWVVLLLICICVLPIGAMDENTGEEDDLGEPLSSTQENTGEAEALDTTLPDGSESQTQPEQEQTTAPVTSDRESESVTTKGENWLPPAREPLWALPIPVIWGTIALVGIAGVTLAVLFLIKYFKQEQ